MDKMQLEGMGATPILCESKLTDVTPGNLKSNSGRS